MTRIKNIKNRCSYICTADCLVEHDDTLVMVFELAFIAVINVIDSGINELKNLQFLPRASESREVMVEDRTRAHADHVGYGLDRSTTAAVGLLKAVHSPDEL